MSYFDVANSPPLHILFFTGILYIVELSLVFLKRHGEGVGILEYLRRS